MSWGLSPDVAMRTTALTCFLLSALLLWGLVRHVGGKAAGLAALVLFLFSPFALLWSRASLIEYLAVAGTLGWIWAGVLWREHRRPLYGALALLGGLTAMLVKPTTGAFWILALLAYPGAAEQPGWRAWLRARRDPVLALVIVIPFLAAAAWTHHADAIKAASGATEWATSARLQSWNLGTVDQRLVAANWSTVVGRLTSDLTLYPAWLLPVAALVGYRTRAARFWAALVGVALLTITVFWNLYVVHDYYLAAVSPVVAAVAGVGLARLWHAIDDRRGRTLVLLVCAWIGAQMALNPYLVQLPYRHMAVADFQPAVVEVSRLTTASDRVVFEGYNWSPTVPYYARRAGFMLFPGTDTGLTAAELTEGGYRVLVTSRLQSDIATGFIRARRWTGVLSQRVYVTGDRPQDLRGAPIAATDDPVEMATQVLGEPVTVRCADGPVELPSTGGATVLQLATDTPGSAKLSLLAGLGDVPARQYLVVAPDPSGRPLVVGCRDATSVTIVGAGAGSER